MTFLQLIGSGGVNSGNPLVDGGFMGCVASVSCSFAAWEIERMGFVGWDLEFRGIKLEKEDVEITLLKSEHFYSFFNCYLIVYFASQFLWGSLPTNLQLHSGRYRRKSAVPI